MRDLIGSKRELADLLGLSERRLTELAKAGVIPARGPQGFDLKASVKGYLQFLKTDPGSLKGERTRCAKLKGDLLQLDVAVRRGELVNKREWDTLTWRCFRVARDNFHNVGARLGGLVAAEPQVSTCAQLIDQEITSVLTATSAELERLCGEADDKEDPR